jgi:hypothetical protein
MLRFRLVRLLITLGLVVALAIPAAVAFADGTETLGPPSIPIATGSGTVSAGVGLVSKSGTININVPTGAIKQVLLYWEGLGVCSDLPLQSINDCRLGQNLTVNGHNLTGQLIGGPTFFYNDGVGSYYSLSYRSDITSLGLIGSGANTLNLSGINFDVGAKPGYADGASVLVIFDNGSTSEIGVRDGNDLAFIGFAPTLDTTVPQTFNFAAEAIARTANLSLFIGSVKSPEYAGGTDRPTRIVVTVGANVHNFDNILSSGAGPTWDNVQLPINVPAGATSLTVQILSVDALGTGFLPASLAWVTAALSVPTTPPPPSVGTGTPGYWMNHPEAWPVHSIVIGGKTYTKDQAIAIMKTAPKGDQTYVMFFHLVAAKLNVANGTNASCISSTIAQADAWMATYGPVGKKVGGGSDAWKIGDPIKNTLDAYNNGLLCAPHRK